MVRNEAREAQESVQRFVQELFDKDDNLHKLRLGSLLGTIARTGYLPHNNESLDSVVELIYEKAIEFNRYLGIIDRERKVKNWVRDVFWLIKIDEFIYEAGLEHGLKFTSEKMVKRIISRTGADYLEGIEERALKIIEEFKGKLGKTDAETIAGAAVYLASNYLNPNPLILWNFNPNEEDIDEAVRREALSRDVRMSSDHGLTQGSIGLYSFRGRNAIGNAYRRMIEINPYLLFGEIRTGLKTE